MEVNINICDGVNTDQPPNVITLETILQHIVVLGETMGALSDKVDQVLALEADEDAQAAAALAAKDAIIADLLSQLEALGVQLTAAMANDASQQAEIDAKTAELETQRAEVQAQIDRLEAAWPTPVVEPPVEEPPVESPGNGGGV